MCFSASASMGSGVVLLAIGAATVYKVPKPSYLMLAFTPIIFSIQQFIESALWVCLTGSNAGLCHQLPTFAFVFIAQSFWPLWMPISLLMIEKDIIRKRWLVGFTCIGGIISLYLLYFTISYGVDAQVEKHHITYAFHYPREFMLDMRWPYLIPTILSHFVSSIKKVQILGGLILLALIVTLIFFAHAAFSVWCFFSAMIGLYIYFIMQNAAHPTKLMADGRSH